MALGALGGLGPEAEAAQSRVNPKYTHRTTTAGPPTAKDLVRRRQGAQALNEVGRGMIY